MSTFQFKHFSVSQANATMKVGTDAMLLGSSVDEENPFSILDIGTGTGVIALMLAQRFNTASVIGLEIDDEACQEAKINFEQSTWKDRLEAIHGDILSIQFDDQFDLIVSNPPYYENSLVSVNERTSRAKHAEFLPVEDLLRKVAFILNENGSFWVIIPSENAESWMLQAELNQLHLQSSISILGKEGQKEKRRILAFSKKKKEVTSSRLTIRNSEGKYTSEYIKLTKEFHDRDLSK